MRRGFTIIEVLIYIALIAFLVPLTADLFLTTVNSGALNREVREARSEAARALQIMTQTIRNSSTIIEPAFNANSTRLIVASTTFSLDAGQIKVQENGGPVEPLTATGFQISDLLFSNSSKFGTPGLVKISFKIKKGDYDKKYYGAAALR